MRSPRAVMATGTLLAFAGSRSIIAANVTRGAWAGALSGPGGRGGSSDLPGRDATGIAICRDCAGITRNFSCTACPIEGRLRWGLCERCSLTDQLRALLDDGTRRIHPPLAPLFNQLRAMAKPRSGLSWIHYRQPRAMLGDLAAGRLALTHEAFSQLPNWRAATYLRDLLMQCGALAPVDRQLLLFQRWLDQYLGSIADPGQALLLHRFATWHQLRTLRINASKGPLNRSPPRHARHELTRAAALLAWLAERDIPIAACRQVDLDTWSIARSGNGKTEKSFLTWCMKNGEMPSLEIPIHQGASTSPAPMGQRNRIAALHRIVTDEALPLGSRVAGSIVLLYAQPVTRIVRLSIDDVQWNDDGVTLNLGDPPTPVPEPLAKLLGAYIQQRPNMTTATNPDSRWLFPGRRAGQPMHPDSLYELLRQIGVPAGSGRTGAIRQLVLQMPPTVVAQALGYHQVSTARIAAQAGSPWSGYAASNNGKDHHESTGKGPNQGIQTT